METMKVKTPPANPGSLATLPLFARVLDLFWCCLSSVFSAIPKTLAEGRPLGRQLPTNPLFPVNFSFMSGSCLSIRSCPPDFRASPASSDIVGLFLNGHEEPNALSGLIREVNRCSHLILVDGGANHYACASCRRGQLHPPPCALIGGDLDSPPLKSRPCPSLRSRFPAMHIQKFDCDKDFTDFEAAFQMTRLDQIAEVCLFYALGGRIDHELTTIQFLHARGAHEKISFFHPIQGRLHLGPQLTGRLETVLSLIERPFPQHIDDHCGGRTICRLLRSNGGNFQPSSDRRFPSFP